MLPGNTASDPLVCWLSVGFLSALPDPTPWCFAVPVLCFWPFLDIYPFYIHLQEFVVGFVVKIVSEWRVLKKGVSGNEYLCWEFSDSVELCGGRRDCGSQRSIFMLHKVRTRQTLC